MDKQCVINLFKELHIENNQTYPLHDMGLAKLFYKLFHRLICYVLEPKSWYIFDGKRWVKDMQNLKIMEFCKTFTYALADYGSQCQDEKMIKLAGSLCHIKRRENIIKDAQSINPKSLSHFDKDKHLFNLQNGTYDLAKNQFCPHSYNTYITKLSSVTYDKNAKCDRWQRFIDEIMQGDEESMQFLQKAFGYSLSGTTDLECFFIFYGSTTRNGKSTCCETISHIFGDYASNVQPETIGRNNKSGSAPSPDIATWLGEKPPTFSDKLRMAIDEALATKPKSFDVFLQLMRAKGFEIKGGKYIAFKGVGQKKFIRLRSLGESYSADYIKAVIDKKATHNPMLKESKKAQQKLNLLVDIQAKLNEGKGKGYEQWATIFNLKQMAKSLNYLQENNLLSYDVLEKKAEEIGVEYDGLLAQIKATENRLTEIKELKTHIINYMKTKDVYAEYKQSGYSKKVQAKYETEIILHKASKAHFDTFGLKKLPTIKSLQTEEQKLYQVKNQAYGKYKKAKQEMQVILNAKMNVDRILNLKPTEKSQEKTQEAR